MKQSSVLIIVPIHNEAKNLKQMLPPLQEIVQKENYDLIAINDASTDESLDILKKHNVQTITLFENLGYGSAVQTGYKFAVEKNYDYLIQVDGDGQHDPRFLPIILKKLQDHDIVIGSRFLQGDASLFSPTGKLYKGTFFRKIGISLFRMLLFVMTGVSISDPTSGYVGMNRKCMQFLSGNHYPFDFPDADVILTLIRNHFRLCEVPVFMYHNYLTGKLHRGILPVWYIFKVTLSLLISRIREKGC